VYLITMQSHKNGKGDYENRFNLETVREINRILDEILRNDAKALILTGGDGKFFSNGHDVVWLEKKFDSGEAELFIREYYQLVARFMSLPIPTVAAINGHAFAGGCLLALAQDYRVMKTEKGFICMNEIDMMQATPTGPPSKIVPGCFKDADRKMVSILNAKLDPRLVRDMFLLGIRFTGSAAKRVGLVDEVADEDLMQVALAVALKVGSKAHRANRRTFAVLKFEQYRQAIEVLCEGSGEELRTSTLSKL
jgi:enoyl-CoA hydratase/carnithine racemase